MWKVLCDSHRLRGSKWLLLLSISDNVSQKVHG